MREEGMDSDDWKEFHKVGRNIKQNRQERHRLFLYSFAYKNKLRYTAVQEWHIRVSSDKTTMDFFPQSKKYHNLTLNKRGTYNNLESFVNSIFRDETNRSSNQDNS